MRTNMTSRRSSGSMPTDEEKGFDLASKGRCNMRKSGKKLMTTAKWIRAVFPAFLVLTGCAPLPKGAGRTIPQDHFAEIQRPDIPLEMNDRVQDWLDYFQG